MEEINNWINNFIDIEEKLNDAFFYPQISDEEYQTLFDAYAKCFYHSMKPYFESYNVRDKEILDDKDSLKDYANYFQKRIHFYTAAYANCEVGEELKNIQSSEVYTFALSNVRPNRMPKKAFNELFFLGKESGTLKIFYNELFMLDHWERPHDYEPLLIKDFGNLIWVDKRVEPEHPPSLELYNKL